MKNTMKRMLLIITAISVCACSSNVNSKANSEKNEEPEVVQLQYNVSVSDDFVGIVKWLDEDGIKCGATFVAYECLDNGEKVFQNEFEVKKGENKTFTAHPDVKKVKIYVSFGNIWGQVGSYCQGWLPLVYYLSPDETKSITIDNTVTIQRSEP